MNWTASRKCSSAHSAVVVCMRKGVADPWRFGGLVEMAWGVVLGRGAQRVDGNDCKNVRRLGAAWRQDLHGFYFRMRTPP